MIWSVQPELLFFIMQQEHISDPESEDLSLALTQDCVSINRCEGWHFTATKSLSFPAVLRAASNYLNSFYHSLSAYTANLVSLIWLARTSPTITPPGYAGDGGLSSAWPDSPLQIVQKFSQHDLWRLRLPTSNKHQLSEKVWWKLFLLYFQHHFLRLHTTNTHF